MESQQAQSEGFATQIVQAKIDIQFNFNSGLHNVYSILKGKMWRAHLFLKFVIMVNLSYDI